MRYITGLAIPSKLSLPSDGKQGRLRDRLWLLEDAILEFKEGHIDREELIERYDASRPTVGGRR